MGFVEGPIRRRAGEMRVVEADHIVGKRDHALARETDAARGDAAVLGVRHAAFFPVPVRIEDGGKRALAAAERAIQISGEVKTGEGLKMDLLDAVTIPLDFPEDARLERSFLRHRPQTAAHENLLANIFGARLPFFQGRNPWKVARGVEGYGCRGIFRLGCGRSGGQGDLGGETSEEEQEGKRHSFFHRE